MQVALQPHESKKLNLVAPEKSYDFSYAIRKELPQNSSFYFKHEDVLFYIYYLSHHFEIAYKLE